MIRRNLNPTSEQQGKSVAERVAAALKAQSTTPTGVKDLGEDGDVLWTNTDTSVSTSVREQEAFTSQLSDKLAAAQQTLDQAQDDIDQAQKSASDAATQAATAVASASAAATQAAQASVDASSAVVLRVDSSEGTTFKNSSGATVFTVAVMAKGKVITDIVDLQSTLGAGAYLEWSWKTRGGGDFGILSSADPRITNGGFALHVSSADVDTTAVFQCSLQIP